MSTDPSTARELTAETTVAGVIGDPVEHSLSPTLHNAAFEHLGIDWVYVAFPVARGDGQNAVSSMRTLGLGGLNVTMPHKAAVARTCDRLSPTAERLGAANTLVWERDELVGHSTDGQGLVNALIGCGVELGPDSVAVVVGAGGAARAGIDALGQLGVSVKVTARRAEMAEAAATLAPGGTVEPWPVTDDAAARILEGATVVVNAVPLGMSPQDEEHPLARVPWDPSTALYEMVYWPSETELMRHVRGCGARADNGLGMLVHQAALAFQLWTGVPGPVEVMRSAADRVIAARGAP
ncbi:MAG: shikimate dehydrogenase [Acidimicrobiia bacterium]|nr:shikimate dehydrogenase [Acidimicrobiia bacterium]